MATPQPLPLWRRLPALFFALAWMAGMVVASGWPRPWTVWLAVAGCGGVWLGVSIRFRGLLRPWTWIQAWGPLVGWMLLFSGLGAARWAWAHRPDPLVDALRARAQAEAYVRVVGQVVRPPRWKGERLRVVVELHYLRDPPEGPAQPTRGRVLVSWPRKEAPDLAYGDVVTLRGRLQTPPVWSTFDYRTYLARRGIYALMYAPKVGVLERNRGSPLLAWIYRLRARAHHQLRRLWPDPEAGFFAGVLLGLDDDIPDHVYDAFRDTGTAHVIVISGFNIAVLTALGLNLLKPLMRWERAAFLTLGLIGGYTVLVGADPAVVRAAIMGGLGLLARHLGRRQHGLTTLTVSAGLMAAVWPDVLWDVAFQLSFAATLGLILYGQTLVEGFERWVARWLARDWARRVSGPVGEFLLLTLAAQWTTLPVVVWHFRRISLISPLANLLVLPVQTPLMVLGGLALVASGIWLPLGQTLAWMAWPWAAYTIRVAEILARVPWASVAVERFWVLLIQGGLWVWLEARRWQPRFPVSLPTPSRWTWIAGLWALNAVLWHRVAHRPDGRLHLWMYPSTASYALLIRTPGGRYLLVNGGVEGPRLIDALGRRLGEQHTLDGWIVPSVEEADITGLLAVWDRYPPQRVLWIPRGPGSYAARRLRRWMAKAQMPVDTLPPGGRLDLGAGARLEVHATTDGGSVLRLRWRRFILPLHFGDIPPPKTRGATAVPEVPFPLRALPGLTGYLSTQAGPITEVHLVTDGQEIWMAVHTP